MTSHAEHPEVEWRVLPGLSDYPDMLSQMEERANAIAKGEAQEAIWLLEHPPLYTAGTSADRSELIDPRFPVFDAGRGGRYTYHGPGQRVGYVMMNLGKRSHDVRAFVHALEGWVIDALAELGVESWRAGARIGIWTRHEGREVKIGAIGVRVRRWVTFHGFSINVDPVIEDFTGIIPCGLPDFGVGSLRSIGSSIEISDLDSSLSNCFSSFLKKI